MNNEDLINYKRSMAVAQMTIQRARRESWRKYCGKINKKYQYIGIVWEN